MDMISAGSFVANRFEIEQAAGHGGMGTIYRACDRVSGQMVALKFLRSDGGSHNKEERFAREAQILCELRHPGIVSYITHDQTLDGERFLAMEWLEGESLAQRLMRGPLSLRECVLLLERVAEALSVAHQNKIIHRDLKPTNLFLVKNQIEQVKILDFGIARRLGTQRRLTRIGMLVGTPEYMAPEQARGGLELTPAADLFALGCVLYECLTGTPPFVAENITAVLVRILFEEPPAIHLWRPGVPEPLLHLLQSLLAKDPAQRLNDAAALRAELAALPELPEPESAAPAAGRSPRAPQAEFANDEQSLVSVVLAALPREDSTSEATLPESGALPDEAKRQALVQALLDLGTRPDFLADGAMVVTVSPMDSARDQAMLAARAALRIKTHQAQAVVSIATGRGTLRGYTAFGEVLEHATRRLRMSGERPLCPDTDGVFVDALSAKLLDGRFTLLPQPDGALLTAEEREADASRLLLGRPTPCVGRETELAMLETQLVGSSEEPEARAVLIMAPPGAGKSRLRHEFLRRLGERREPPTVLLGAGDMMSTGAPYGILGRAIRRLCGLDGSEPLSVQRAQLAAHIGLSLAGPSRSRVIEFVGELCRIPFPGDNESLIAARQDPLLLQTQIRRAFIEWVATLCQRCPVLIVLDDIQWGDALSTSLLDEALRELQGARLSVLALGRPEVRDVFPKLWTRHKLLEVTLNGLGKKACERLVRKVLGTDVPDKTVDQLIEQSAGNALFLEELIRACAEKEPVERPDTVLAMLQARIGQLDRWLRRTIGAASVFGRTFWRGGVRALLSHEGSSQPLDAAFENLVRLEMIERCPRSRFLDEVEYQFRHVLVRDAAYGLLSQTDQELGNCLAGRYLENAGERDAMVLAEHAFAGRDFERAAVHYQSAAEESYQRHDIDGLAQRIERAIQSGARGAALGQLLALKIQVCYWRVDYQAARSLIREALPLLLPGSRWWSIALGALVSQSIQHADVTLMNFAIEELLRHHPAQDALVPYYEAVAHIVASASAAGQRERAMWFFEQLDRIDPLQIKHEALARGHIQFSMALFYIFLEYDPYLAYRNAQQSVAAFEQAKSTRLVNMASMVLAEALEALGDYARAEGMIRTGLADAVARGDVFEIITGRHQLLLLLAERCKAEQRSEVVELARELIETSSMEATAGHAHGARARALMAQGRLAEAEEAAEMALSILLATRALRPRVLRTLIEIRLRRGQVAAAQRVVDEAQQYLKIHGGAGRSEVLLRVAIAEAQLGAGGYTEARASLEEVKRLIERCAERMSDPVMRDRYRLEVPENARAWELTRTVLGSPEPRMA